MDPDSFDISELARLAGVTGRTVRYYVQQGLLPAPAARGPGARYGQVHLDRLQLIRRLQSEHLPLAEIRRRLESLGDDEVRHLLLAPRPASTSSALDYVRRVLGSPVRRSIAPPAAAPSVAPRPAQSFLRAGSPPPDVSPPSLAEASEAFVAMSRVTDAEPAREYIAGPSMRSTWERITLAPDIELHVRRPLSRAQNKLVDHLLREAHNLQPEEP
jgi:DNA-binding transcriptional MerR regulator